MKNVVGKERLSLIYQKEALGHALFVKVQEKQKANAHSKIM